MAGLTRSQLRDRAKRRAEMQNSQYIDDDEWNFYLDDASAELHDLCLSSDPRCFSKIYEFPTVVDAERYPIPDDYYLLHAAYCVDNAGRRIYPLRKINMHQIGYEANAFYYVFIGNGPYGYDIIGNEFWLYPRPKAVRQMQFVYAPQYERFTDDNSTLDYPTFNGWEQFVVVSAAIFAKTREETDTTMLLNEKAQIADRIRRGIAARDQFESRSMIDMTGQTSQLWSFQRTRRFY